VDRVCIARIPETESQLRSCHKTVPFKLFSKNLGVSMCTRLYAWILYMYNILLEHNTVKRKQALYFYTRIKQETFVWINIMADRFLPPSEHPPTAQCTRPNVCVVYVFNSRKNKILLFFSQLTIALTYLSSYFSFLFFLSIPSQWESLQPTWQLSARWWVTTFNNS